MTSAPTLSDERPWPPPFDRLTSHSVLHQEKLDPEVLCKENPILPEAAEHLEESEVVPGEACRAAVGSGR